MSRAEYFRKLKAEKMQNAQHQIENKPPATSVLTTSATNLRDKSRDSAAEQDVITPAWITNSLKSLPKMVETLPKMAPFMSRFNMNIPKIPISSQGAENICTSLQSGIEVVLQWFKNPFIFVWFVLQMILSLSLIMEISVPILMTVNSFVLFTTLFHYFVVAYKTNLVILWAELNVRSPCKLFQRIHDAVQNYETLENLFQIKFIQKLVLVPLKKASNTSQILPWLLYLSSLNLLLVKAAYFHIGYVSFVDFWILQFFIVFLLDFVPHFCLHYACGLQLYSFVAVLSFGWSTMYFIVPAILLILCVVAWEISAKTKQQFHLIQLSYGNYMVPFIIQAAIGTALWPHTNLQMTGYILVLQIILNGFWIVLCGLATKARIPVIGVTNSRRDQIIFAISFLSLFLTMQNAFVAWLHMIVSFWFLVDIIYDAGNKTEIKTQISPSN